MAQRTVINITTGETSTYTIPPQPLQEVKRSMRDAINAQRHALENGIVQTPLGAVNCDLDSRNKINGAVLMAILAAQAGQPFSVGWTMADNSVVTHDGAAMIAMGQAVGVYVATLHGIGAALKAAVAAAETHAALDAIDLQGPWA